MCPLYEKNTYWYTTNFTVFTQESFISIPRFKFVKKYERVKMWCILQGSASLLLQTLEKERELLRIFLKVSQMENTLLRRMNLHSFLMVMITVLRKTRSCRSEKIVEWKVGCVWYCAISVFTNSTWLSILFQLLYGFGLKKNEVPY